MISEENTYLIRNILLKDPMTRENDMSLYIEYLKEKNIEPDNDVLINPERYKVANFKTVERTRRKLQVVKEDGYDIEYINNPSEKIKLEAVRQNGYAIQCINNPSEEVQLEAIKKDGLAIRYVKNPPEKMLQETIKRFDMNNTYKLKYMLKFLENDLKEDKKEETNDTI